MVGNEGKKCIFYLKLFLFSLALFMPGSGPVSLHECIIVPDRIFDISFIPVSNDSEL